MVIPDNINNDNHARTTNSSVASNTRGMFFRWLSSRVARKLAPRACVECIDKVSDYITSMGIYPHIIWDCNDYDTFRSISAKVRDNRKLRRIDRDIYDIFKIAGKLYLRFLKELSWNWTIPDIAEFPVSENIVSDRVGDKSSDSNKGSPNTTSDASFTEFTPKKTDGSNTTNGEIKIGAFVREKLRQLSESGFVFSEQQLHDICDLHWSRKNLKLGSQYPFAKIFDRSVPVAVLTKDEAGCNRYWNQAYPFGDVNLVFTNNWYERSRISFVEWFTSLDSDVSLEHVLSDNFTHGCSNRDAYRKKDITSSDKLDDNTAMHSPKTEDSAVMEQLSDVLSTHFSNGYRLNSPIEMTRLRSFAKEGLGEELALSDDELKTHISACGTIFEGKVYVISFNAKERIKNLAEGYFADGAQVIFFSAFYAMNENWLFEASIVSEDMLISILRSLFPKLFFTQTYFGVTDATVYATLESELLRVWNDEILLTYDQLAERLPCIPLDRIKHALGQNGDFIWNSVETFSHISRLQITDDERVAIQAAATRVCNAHGYVSITDLPLDEIDEKNCGLSVNAIHNAVYRICLSDKFDKKGKIITRKGNVFDALTIMKEYCRTVDKCSLSDLLAFEKELTGEIHRWIPMEAGNTILIRIDKDNYVADRYVHFNADVIDNAIELAVKGDYLPLKAFTTFSAFPDCGQTWNLFLLESYCRRFSRMFRFDAPSVNSRNAGAVIRKSCGMNYTEIMTAAVAISDVSLTANAVGRFLYESGYTGKNTTAKVAEIIDKAKAMRGE